MQYTNEMISKDISFLKELKENVINGHENCDIASYEMAVEMIDHWIHDLNKKQETCGNG